MKADEEKTENKAQMDQKDKEEELKNKRHESRTLLRENNFLFRKSTCIEQHCIRHLQCNVAKYDLLSNRIS